MLTIRRSVCRWWRRARGSALAGSTAPAYAGDFPDPYVVTPAASGTGSYWAYATGSAGRNLQVMSSPDLTTWSAVSDPLPTLPTWARPGHTWSPTVAKFGSSFLMYYTVRDTASDRQCISVASATTPGGPFTDDSPGPFICQREDGGSIDPNVFVAPGGETYLLWKSDDNAVRRPTSLWGAQLASTGAAFVGDTVRLLPQDAPWQAPLIEGPAMVAAGDRCYLFYGANWWNTSRAAIGFAVCDGPLGPCSDASLAGPWMSSHGTAVGPSGPAVFTDSTGTHLAYHAWTGAVGYARGGVRSLWIDELTFPSGVPALG
jgi:glycosyl hydrolase family 43